MRFTLLFLIFYVSTQNLTLSQSSSVGFLFDETTFYYSTDNINFSTEFSPWGFYTTYRLYLINGDPLIVNNAYLNRVGLNYGFLNNAINIGGGVKMVYETIPEFYPDVTLKVYPYKFITEDPRSVDVGLILNVSNTFDLGVCLTLPFVLNRY
jgi:hypothetical protein